MPSNADTYESYAVLLRHLEDAGATVVEDGDPSVDAEGVATAEVVVGFDGGLASELEAMDQTLPEGAAGPEAVAAMHRRHAAVCLQRDELARRAAARPGRYEIQSQPDVVRKVLRDRGSCTAAEIDETADADFDVHNAIGRLEDGGEVVSREHDQDARKTVYSLADVDDTGRDRDRDSPTAADLTPRRREVFDQVRAADDGTTAQAIAAEHDVTVEAVSKHLRPMVEDGLLDRERHGKQYVYAVAEAVGVDRGSVDPIVDEAEVRAEIVDVPRFTDYGADDGPDDQCKNCGTPLVDGFSAVFEPEEEDGARCCPHCEDKVREADGTVREKKNISEEARRRAATDGGERA